MPVLVGTNPLAPEGFATEVLTQAFVGGSDIVFSDTDPFGVRWAWCANNTWGAKPSPRENTGDREYAHGQWDATRFYGPRTLAIPGWVMAPDHGTLHAAEQRLRDAITIEPFMFRVVEPGFDSYAMVRQQGAVEWSEVNRRVATFSVGLYASDPLIYSTLERAFDLDFPVSSGGLEWPATWPATWDAVVVSGSRELYNPSNFPVGLKLRIDGPARTASIAYPDTGQALNLADPDGGDILTAGQWLDIDTTTRQVLLNGEAGRRSWAYPTGDGWLLLPPGTTTVAIAGTGTTPDSHVSGSFRAARL